MDASAFCLSPLVSDRAAAPNVLVCVGSSFNEGGIDSKLPATGVEGYDPSAEACIDEEFDCCLRCAGRRLSVEAFDEVLELLSFKARAIADSFGSEPVGDSVGDDVSDLFERSLSKVEASSRFCAGPGSLLTVPSSAWFAVTIGSTAEANEVVRMARGGSALVGFSMMEDPVLTASVSGLTALFPNLDFDPVREGVSKGMLIVLSSDTLSALRGVSVPSSPASASSSGSSSFISTVLVAVDSFFHMPPR